MKKKKLSGLHLKKSVISSLNPEAISRIRGGDVEEDPTAETRCFYCPSPDTRKECESHCDVAVSDSCCPQP